MLSEQFKKSLIKNREELIKDCISCLFKTIYSIEYKTLLVQKIKKHKKAIHKYNL